jgi:mannonate dehydratase
MGAAQMQRRDFGKAVVGGVVGAGFSGLAVSGTASAKANKPRKNTQMHPGADYHVVAGNGITSKENIQYNLRWGVKHISPDPDLAGEVGQPAKPIADSSSGGGGEFIPAEGPMGGAFDLEKLKRMRDAFDKFGMAIEAFRMDSGYILLKPGSDRERKLDQICENIRKSAQVGVGIISQHWTAIPIRRNGKQPGRGDSVYTTFKLERNWKDLPVTQYGHLSYDEYWERITTFLQRVMPVCAEYKVKMANHVYDPPGLPYGYQGVENFDSPSIFDAYKRYATTVDSPYNCFQLDVGVLAEGSTDANQQIPPLVQWLADRGKIAQVHMRAIHGGLNDFAEVYPDEGVLDLFPIVRILRDSGFEGSIMPDHMPASPGDPGKLQAYAFGYGYLHALINAANSEVD